MSYAWTWLGAANLVASILLLVLAALFLRATRSEFTLAFAAYCTATAAQKSSGGMWLYLAADEKTRNAWHLVVSVLYLVVIPLLFHALSVFVWGKRWTSAKAKRFAIYAPSLALVPLLVIDPARFENLSLVLALIFTFLLLPFVFLVARRMRNATLDLDRTQSRYMFVYLVIVLAFTAEARALTLFMGRTPWWELSMAYTVATSILLYGILKTHLFDIDVKLKWTLKNSTIAAVFIGVFIVVEQLVQSLVSQALGVLAGAISAGLLLVVLHPIQRAAERLANAAMPGVRPLHEMAHPERSDLYKEQAAIAWADGILTTDERRMLDAARSRLGLTAEEAMRIEAEAMPTRST